MYDAAWDFHNIKSVQKSEASYFVSSNNPNANKYNGKKIIGRHTQRKTEKVFTNLHRNNPSC